MLQVVLAKPRGFCAGVERAIHIVEAALEKFGPPIYVRHEIVHNQRVVQGLRQRGVIFVDDIEQIPDGAITVFSAHGVSKKVESGALEQGLNAIDATCPLVSKVHREGQRYAKKGYEIILIGHRNHPEVEGTLGQIPGKVHLVGDIEDVSNLDVENPEKVAYITQTTLSVDDTREIISALKNRFPAIAGPDIKDICYATQNRQTAVRKLAEQVDALLVVGASNSSNSNRLCEVGNDNGIDSYLVESPEAIDRHWIEGVNTVGITAGASTPEELVEGVIERLREFDSVEVSTMSGITENVKFTLPNELQEYAHLH